MAGFENFAIPGVFDILLAGAICLSLMIGLFRGLVREILSLVSWVLALWLTYLYGGAWGSRLGEWLQSPEVARLVGSVSVFVVTLILLSLAGSLISRLFRATGLTGMDRLLGGVFGAARGLVLVAAVLLGAKLTPATEQDWYNQSTLVPYFDPAVKALSNKVGSTLMDPGWGNTPVRVPQDGGAAVLESSKE